MVRMSDGRYTAVRLINCALLRLMKLRGGMESCDTADVNRRNPAGGVTLRDATRRLKSTSGMNLMDLMIRHCYLLNPKLPQNLSEKKIDRNSGGKKRKCHHPPYQDYLSND